MNPLLKRLLQDHANMTQVHQLFKQEMMGFDNPKRQPDIMLLLDIMDYLHNYVDQCHHPVEDQLYNIVRVEIKDSAIIELLDHMELQHIWLQILSDRLQGCFEGIATRKNNMSLGVIEDFHNYIAMVEEHLACENKYLLPAIETHLSGDVMQKLMMTAIETLDPLSGLGTPALLFDRMHTEVVATL